MTKTKTPVTLDVVRGDATGMEMPAHPQSFEAMGLQFLTRAFRAFGSLPEGNRLKRILDCEPCTGGSTGKKLTLTVEYEIPDPSLDNELFVKFSRDFDDEIRDLQKGEMESEVHLAQLSRHPAFPITVPKTYFADFESATGTGMMITSRIRFGENGIEPHRAKCMDHELANPLEYYRAIFKALGRLVATHKSGQLSPDVEQIFPFKVNAALAQDKIPYDEISLRAQLDRFVALATNAPQLFPAHVLTSEFIAKFKEEAVRFLEHETAVKRYLHTNADYVALCHWNANIDNAWFWRNADGELNCGLFDWGRVRQLNLAYSLWGCLLGAPLEIWDDHLDELLQLFIAEICEGGGPALSSDELKLQLNLYVAMIGLAAALCAPDRILLRLPEAVTATGPRDPIFRGSPQAHNFLHLFTNFLNLWARQDFGRSLDLMLSRL